MTFLAIFDFGHGLDTAGKRTPLFPDGSFMRENEFNRSVGMKAYQLLEAYENIDVVFTTTEKRDIPLSERVARVNELYNKVKSLYTKIVLVSVHANTMKDYWNDLGNGTATFYYLTNMTDKAFAEVIQKNLIAKTGLKPHRGGVVGENFQIIRDVQMTACLCECAFMDNLTEAKLLLTDEFRQTCAEGIVSGLLEYFGIGGNEEVNVEYKKYNNGMTEIKGEVKDLGTAIVDKRIWDITEFTNCTNGTLYWVADGKTYATSILYHKGVIYQHIAEHYNRFGCPQSVFIVYKDGTVGLKRIHSLSELDLSKVSFVAGGVGLRNTQDSNFKYDPTAEGFKRDINKITGKIEDHRGVLVKRNKTVLGYNKRLDKAYLLTVPNATHDELIKLISVGEEHYDIAISLDGGGSTFMDALGKYVFEGENSRRIHNIIGFGL